MCNVHGRVPTNGIRDLEAHTVYVTHGDECNDFHVQPDDWVGQMQRLCQWRYAEYWIRCWKARCTKLVDKGTEKERSMRFAKSRHFVLWTGTKYWFTAHLFLALNFCDISFLDIFQRKVIEMFKYKGVKIFAIIYKEKSYLLYIRE